jgi:hypothetical protein
MYVSHVESCSLVEKDADEILFELLEAGDCWRHALLSSPRLFLSSVLNGRT